MVLIDSVYINRSGGKILLEYLIKYILDKKDEYDFYFLLDKRIDISNIINIELLNFEYLPPSEKSRREFYNNNIDLFSSVLCFANVPPPIKIKDKVVSIYFHNVLLADYNKANLSVFSKLMMIVKKYYIKLINHSSYNWFVQTPIIKKIIVDTMGIKSEMVSVMPFFDISNFKNCNELKEYNYKNYLYVADSSSQKNHLQLLRAWALFTQKPENIQYTLHLTLPITSSKLILDKIEFLKSTGTKIINHKECSVYKIKQLYKISNYFIFPSLAESFGLPLIEAAAAGCKIIAADLPYVFNIIEPSLVFNPNDYQCILNSLITSKDYRKVKNTNLLIENNINQLLNTIKYV
jgi:glycosyltransferase involved in cell wall biosynthesis